MSAGLKNLCYVESRVIALRYERSCSDLIQLDRTRPLYRSGCFFVMSFARRLVEFRDGNGTSKVNSVIRKTHRIVIKYVIIPLLLAALNGIVWWYLETDCYCLNYLVTLKILFVKILIKVILLIKLIK